ncbi:MAG: calcium-translocating P-type ATPase, PMCA-type [Kiloniellaceae bacterium]
MRRAVPLSRLAGLDGGQQGLSAEAAERQRGRYGANAILEEPPARWRDTLRDTLRDPMVWFLLGTAAIFTWLGDYAEAAVLAAALLPIVGMDAYLHRRTQATTAGLSGRLAAKARVLRDGRAADIPATAVVPGDLAVVREGEAFPADGVIVAGDGLQVDESALTGEAMPVRKQPLTVLPHDGADEAAVDGSHWGAAGTRLLTGEARLRIVFTGGETLYGEIVRTAVAGRHTRTPLQQAIGSLVSVLLVVAGLLCLALAGIRYAQGYGLLDALLSAVTLAVAALPEEFPVVFTFFLGVGVYRLAQCQALVRRAVVVENIGRVTWICTDKTGTLTEGRLTLAHRLPADGFDAERLCRLAATAARPESGDPLDVLLLETAAPLEGERLAVFPFTEDRRREAAIVQTPTGALSVAVKGAPETVLAMTGQSDSARDAWLAKTRELAATGHKVIACAYRPLDSWSGGEPDRGFHFAGLLAFEDPLRDGVAEAVAQARAAGIGIIMVTGDHPLTAAAIATEAGIGTGESQVVEGSDLDALLQRDGAAALRRIDAIARAIPAQKLDLVRALQRDGEIVAVTGDGVNDVPALQGADIGIAMGGRGTRAAREVAAIVLLDDNFRTIVRAIAEGRQLFTNLKLSFAYLLMIHAPLVATAALIPLAGFPLLYLPAHIVWLELIIHPTALLVFQQLPTSAALAPQRNAARLRFFTPAEWAVIALVGALITGLLLFGYNDSLGADRDVPHARSMAMVALIVASATVTAALSGLRSRAALVTVAATIASAVVIVQVPPLAGLLHLSPLHLADWLIAAVGGGGVGALAMLIPARPPRLSKPRRATPGRS